MQGQKIHDGRGAQATPAPEYTLSTAKVNKGGGRSEVTEQSQRKSMAINGH